MSTMPMAIPLRERAAVRVRPELPALLFLAAALNLWALEPQRHGERLLRRRGALDEHELARVPLRLVRRQRRA